MANSNPKDSDSMMEDREMEPIGVINLSVLFSNEDKKKIKEMRMNEFKIKHVKKYVSDYEDVFESYHLYVTVSSNGLDFCYRHQGKSAQGQEEIMQKLYSFVQEIKESLVLCFYQLGAISFEKVSDAIQNEETFAQKSVSCHEHSDGITVVCKKNHQQSVSERVVTILGSLCQEGPNAESSLETVPQTITDKVPVSFSSPAASLSLNGGSQKSVVESGKQMDSETSIFHLPVVEVLIEFLTEKTQAFQFVQSEFNKMGMKCQILPEQKCLQLRQQDGLKTVSIEDVEEKYAGIIHIVKFTDVNHLFKLFSRDEIFQLFMQDERIAGKIKAVRCTDSTFDLWTTSDVLEIVQEIKSTVKQSFFEIDRCIWEILTKDDDRELKKLCDGKVICRQLFENEKCVLHILGTTEARDSFEGRLNQFLTAKTTCIQLPTFMKVFLAKCPHAVQYVKEKAKYLDIEIIWEQETTSLLMLQGGEDQHSQIQSMLSKLILRNDFPLEKQCDDEDKIVDLLMREESLHHGKALAKKGSDGKALILIVTDDIFSDVHDFVVSKMKKTQENDENISTAPVHVSSLVMSGSNTPIPTERIKRKLTIVSQKDGLKILCNHMQKTLLKEKYAEDLLKKTFHEKGFPLHVNLKDSCVEVEVKTLMENKIAEDIWQSTFLTREVDFEKSIPKLLIDSKHVLKTLEEQFPDLRSKVSVRVDGKLLTLIGLTEIAKPVVKSLEMILQDYSQYVITLTVSEEEAEKLKSCGSEFRKFEQMDKSGCSSVGIDKDKVTLICPSCENVTIREPFLKYVEKKLEYFQGLSSSQEIIHRKYSVSLPEDKVLALKKNETLRKTLQEKFKSERLLMIISEDVYFGSVSFLDLKDAEELFRSELIEKTLILEGTLVRCMLRPEEICSRLASLSHCEFDVVDMSFSILKFVGSPDIEKKLDEAFAKITDEYESSVIDTTKVKFGGISTPEELTRELWKIKPELKDKARVVVDDGSLKLVTLRDVSEFALEKMNQLCLKLTMEDGINKENPFSILDLSPLHVSLLRKHEVMNYVYQRVRSQHLQLLPDLDSTHLYVYALTKEDAEYGKTLVESCFRFEILPFLDDPISDNLTLEEFQGMMAVQEAVHHGKIEFLLKESEQKLMFLCTDDVYEGVMSKYEGIKRTCSDIDDFVEFPSIEAAMYVKKYLLEPKVSKNFPEVKISLRHENGKGIFVLSGKKKDISQARDALNDLTDKVRSMSFDVKDEDYELLLSHGTKIKEHLEKNNKCIISVPNSKDESVESEDDQIEIASPEKKNENNDDCSNSTSSSLHIVDGDVSDMKKDIIALASVGELSPAIETFFKKESVYEECKSLLSKLLRNQHQGQKHAGQQTSPVHFLSQHDKVALCLLPRWESGKEKEKANTRSCIEELLSRCMRKSASSVGIIIDVSDEMFKKIVKQIIYACQDFQSKKGPLHIYLWCPGNQKENLQSILKPSHATNFRRKLKHGVQKILPKGTASSGEIKQIVLKVGDLAYEKADVIVNSVDKELNITKGGVAKRLNEATKGALQRELKKGYPKGICKGKFAVTEPAGLKCKKVIHGTLKPYDDEKGVSKSKGKKVSGHSSKWELMKTFIHRCLHEACQSKYRSVAFPVLGCGNLRYPPEVVVQVMFNSVEQFFKEYKNKSLTHVIFVLYPMDEEIIKLFHVEWMARNYGVNLQLNKETIIDCEKIAVQVFHKDIWNSSSVSDGLLCFWNEQQLLEPSEHPVVGDVLDTIQWETYGNEMKEKSYTTTTGGELPANFIFHIKTDEQNFKDVLNEVIFRVSGTGCYTLQIPVFDKVNDLSWDKFAEIFFQAIKQKRVQDQSLTVVTFLPMDAEVYKALLKSFRKIVGTHSSDGPAMSTISGTVKWMSSKYIPNYFSKKPSIQVAAADETACQKAFNTLKKEINRVRQEGTPVDSGLDNAESDLQNYALSDGEISLDSTFLRHPKWNEAKEELLRNDIKAMPKGGRLILYGKCEKLAQAFNILSDIFQSGSFRSSLSSDDCSGYSNKEPFTVTDDLFAAFEYLIGQHDVSDYCKIVDDPPTNKKIYFKIFKDDKEKMTNAQKIEQRMRGVIQEVVEISETEKGKVGERVKAAMSESNDLFIMYKPETNSVVIFAEDWENMAKGKKKIQPKATSRGHRKFAPQPNTDSFEGKASLSDQQKSSDCFEGKNIKVMVYEADITKLPVDVIVNAANGHLSHGGGVARAIADAAGYELTREGNDIVRQFGEIPVTNLVVTTAGNLPCKKVFHAVGPQWSSYDGGNKSQCSADLCFTILRCLCQAENLNMESIAIPSISAAIFRVPEKLCAEAYVRALKSFDQTVKTQSLKEVHFVDISDKMVKTIRAALEETWIQPLGDIQFDREKEYIKTWLYKSEKDVEKGKKNTKTKLTELFHQVEFISGDISTKQADAMVSWENITFIKSQFVREMMKAGGRELEEGRNNAYLKCRQIGDIESGPGGFLAVSQVIYITVPISISPDELVKGFEKILKHVVSARSLIVPVWKGIKTGSGKDWKMAFVESLVRALQVFTSGAATESKRILVWGEHDHEIKEMEKRFNEHIKTLSLQQEECVICMESIKKPTKLKCGHVFCDECIKQALKVKPVCPICKTVCGVIRGNMPKGTMNVTSFKYTHLPGHEKYGCLRIEYNFFDGIQSDGHPNPGKPYRGTNRTAYLPDSPEGREILELLEIAWDRRLTFTIDQSVTIGDGKDRVTWNEIHHKTKMTGGETNHGYPDPNYLKRVREELAAQGVTVDDLGAAGTSV